MLGAHNGSCLEHGVESLAKGELVHHVHQVKVGQLTVQPLHLSIAQNTSLDLGRFTSFKLCRSGSKTSFHSGWGSVSDPYSFDTDPDPIRIQGFDDQNLEKFAAEKKIGSKTTVYYPSASIKDVQATTIKKGTSSTSKHEISFNFLYVYGSF
jgi:hypothetical protein